MKLSEIAVSDHTGLVVELINGLLRKGVEVLCDIRKNMQVRSVKADGDWIIVKFAHRGEDEIQGLHSYSADKIRLEKNDKGEWWLHEAE